MLDYLDEAEIASRFRDFIGENAARHFGANARARRLYQQMGFEADGSRRVEDAYGAQQIRLSRALGS